MADSTITNLTELITTEDSDVLAIVDIDAGPATTKKITTSNLVKNNPDVVLNTAHRAIVSGNPHVVTKADVGLSSVDNTSDVDKPVSTAQGLAIGAVSSDLNDHELDLANPHAVTKAQVGLGSADNTSDADKPVSTAQQTALDLKYDNTNPDGFIDSAAADIRDTANRARVNHTGTQLASTISDFTTAVEAVSSYLVSSQQAVGVTVSPSRDNAAFALLQEMSIALVPSSATNLIYVKFTGSFVGVDKDDTVDVAIFIDGVEVPNTKRQSTVKSSKGQSLGLEKFLTLSAAAHTIEARWKTGTLDLGVTAIEDDRILIVQEWNK